MTSTTTVRTAVGTHEPDLVPIRDHNALQTLKDAADAGLFAFCTVYTKASGAQAFGYTVLTDDGVWALGRRTSDLEESVFATRFGKERIPQTRAEVQALVQRDKDIVTVLESQDPMILLGLKPRAVMSTIYGSQLPPEWR